MGCNRSILSMRPYKNETFIKYLQSLYVLQCTLKKFLFYLCGVGFGKIGPTIDAPGFSRLVVRLTDQLPVFHEVEFVARVELSATHQAGETFQVVHIVLGAAHHLSRGNPLLTASTLSTIASKNRLENTHTLQRSNNYIKASEKKILNIKTCFKYMNAFHKDEVLIVYFS